MLSRIFRGENENAAGKRKRQIDTLKIFNDNVLELREDVEYQVQFDAGDRRMAIMVSLSPKFPLEKPVLRVSPPVIHPWCNEHSEIISAPGLLNFTIHSDLGRVVQAIIREFSKNPPRLIDESSAVPNLQHIDIQGRASPSYTVQAYDLPSTSFNSYYNSHLPQFSSTNTNACVYNYNYTNSGNTYITDTPAEPFVISPHHTTYVGDSQTNTSVLHNTNPAQYSSSSCRKIYLGVPYVNSNYVQPASVAQTESDDKFGFPEIEKLSMEELKKLNQDNDKLEQYVNNHPVVKEIDAEVDTVMDWVERTATLHLSKEEELNKLKADVAEKVNLVKELKGRYDRLSQQYNKLSETFAPYNIKDCLRHAADESHEQSDKIADEFLNGKIDVERFLSTYIECRKLGQARRTKEEKLAHQLNELKRAGY